MQWTSRLGHSGEIVSRDNMLAVAVSVKQQQCTWDMTRGMQDFLCRVGGCMGVQVEG